MRLRLLTVPLLVLGIGTARTSLLTGQVTGADAVLDVMATGPAGAPLATLGPQDLMLRIDGRVHPIAELRLSQATHAPSLLPPPFATNQTDPGRGIAIAVDVTRLLSTDLAVVKNSVGAVVASMAPHDRISVIALAEDGFATDYTTRPEIVRAIVDKLPATGTTLDGQKANETAALASLALLERQCAALAINPAHKTLVFVAPPMPTSTPIRRAIQSLASVTAAQRLQLVIVNPREVASPSGGLTALAAATGGIVLASSADLAARLTALAGRGAARYEVRFNFVKEERDDKLHRVQLVSLRKDVQLTSPAQVFIPKAEAGPEPLAALTDMLRQPRAWSDLPLRVAVFPVLDVERDRLRLLVLGEPEEQMRPLAWAQFALIAPSGAVVAEWKAEGADLAARPIMTAALAPAGPYRLRMAASELVGRRGAVDYEFDARLTPAGAFNLGPLMFGGIANQAFLPLLQPPADAPAVMAYVEIYGRPAATDTLAARFEVAATAQGEPLSSTTGSIRTTPNDDRRAALATLDLASLAPGDYHVRAIITLNGEEIGSVTRTLRKAAR